MSDIPTLLLSGQFDPATPPRFADIAAETLSNSYSFVVPMAGHGVGLDTSCGPATHEKLPAPAGPVPRLLMPGIGGTAVFRHLPEPRPAHKGHTVLGQRSFAEVEVLSATWGGHAVCADRTAAVCTDRMAAACTDCMAAVCANRMADSLRGESPA